MISELNKHEFYNPKENDRERNITGADSISH
ncbi:hypothetical protein DET56_10577 [Paenibacillus pabuli]|uniref:Uncharacterized protein n=1 Tax=Paenibacillus pabuli TaxID=1472 RepID=A0A855YA27_9BACL|nr:hypothetical protein DET56_10577 [Paenibacillus pabuli]PXW11929.1 hypothetical protein DEU73_101800 [Paenibacillus taichungensis]